MLKPVTSDDHIALGDDDARPPRRLPSGAERDREIASSRKALTAFQERLYAEGTRGLLVVLQGRSASGKDGIVRKLFTAFSPQGCTVTSFKAPTGAELRHDYLWRIHAAVPSFGAIAVFNRSHYEDVIMPRVLGTVKGAALERRYEQINEFERMLDENGVRVVKFMLHVSRATQRERMQKRLANPDKRWKFDEHDLTERDRWDEYTEAYRAALSRCSTPHAPWYVVPGDDKRARDLLVARVMVRVAKEMAPDFPDLHPSDLTKSGEIP